jgi:hypothetical protein
MTTLAAAWAAIASALGLDIQTPIEVTLPDGTKINAPVLLKNFGAERGMLLFEVAFPNLFETGNALVAMGYGFSCLGPYGDAEVDLASAKEALADWEWSGPPDQRPSWLADPPSDDDD